MCGKAVSWSLFIRAASLALAVRPLRCASAMTALATGRSSGRAHWAADDCGHFVGTELMNPGVQLAALSFIHSAGTCCAELRCVRVPACPDAWFEFASASS